MLLVPQLSHGDSTPLLNPTSFGRNFCPLIINILYQDQTRYWFLLPKKSFSLVSVTPQLSLMAANWVGRPSPINNDRSVAGPGFHFMQGTGKKCFMVAARELVISWGDTPHYWKWSSHPDSRFSEVANLQFVCWLDMRG